MNKANVILPYLKVVMYGLIVGSILGFVVTIQRSTLWQQLWTPPTGSSQQAATSGQGQSTELSKTPLPLPAPGSLRPSSDAFLPTQAGSIMICTRRNSAATECYKDGFLVLRSTPCLEGKGDAKKTEDRGNRIVALKNGSEIILLQPEPVPTINTCANTVVSHWYHVETAWGKGYISANQRYTK